MSWSSIGIALSYPDATVDGYDIDAPSIEAARRSAAEAGVADRVRFHCMDAGTVDAGSYDLVAAFECIHDLPDPVGVLASMRALAGKNGTVLVMDERVAETFSPHPATTLMCCPSRTTSSASTGCRTADPM